MSIGEIPKRVALVEDDGPLRALLARTIKENGYEVKAFASAAEFRPAFADQPFDLAILDVMLPGTSGIDICRWLRERSNIPVIFVSARGGRTDRIVGLEIGADDYMVKPVDPEELVARIRAVMRRSDSRPDTDSEHRGRIGFDGWSMDQRRRELFAPDGARVDMTEAEFDLLVALTDMPQRVVSRDLLLEHARGRLSDTGNRSVDVLVSRLRRKLGNIDGGRDLIRTVRGLGYVFVAQVER